MKIIFTNIYSKKIDKLLTDSERIEAENEIAKDPLAWPIIKGSGGIRKARAKRGNSGKSGGIRIIYYYYSTIVITNKINRRKTSGRGAQPSKI